jgi:hypothetical protein
MTAARVVRTGGDLPLAGDSLFGLMREVLAKGKPFRFRARGLSMSPFIKDGDVLTVAPLGTAPRAGDVAAFLHPATGRLVVHRMIRKRVGRYEFKGDNAHEVEGGVGLERILGIVTSVEREGREVGLARRAGRALAGLSRTGLLRKAVGAARRAGVRRGRR